MTHNLTRWINVLSALIIAAVSLAGNGVTAQMEPSSAPEGMAMFHPITQPPKHSTATDATLLTGSALQSTDADWSWQNPLPQGNPLFAVWGSSGNNVFAVGRYGTILQYDGNALTMMSSGITEPLYGVWGSGSSDVFTVGGNGMILHYDGSVWSTMSSGVTETLRGVWGSSSSDVFVVGESGTILHYDGSKWNAMGSGTNVTLHGVWGSGGSDVFAVGDSGVILYYNGSGWSVANSGTTEHFVGVWGSSGSDIFAVGGTILHYDGDVWAEMGSGLLFNNGVWGSSSTDVFVVGDGPGGSPILHYDGNQWDDIGIGGGLFGVWGNNGNDVFAVGMLAQVSHYNGIEWSKLTGICSYTEFNGVWGNSKNDVFAVGYGYVTASIFHYDGSGWSGMSSSPVFSPLNGVWGSGGSDVFAVGGSGTILHYDGGGWNAMSSGITETLNGVWGSNDSDIFAVGESGTILHYGGSGWSAMSSGTTSTLNGIWGNGGSDIFVVGGSGTILHYDGSEWSMMNSGTHNWLNGVWGNNGGDVLAVGSISTILHYRDTIPPESSADIPLYANASPFSVPWNASDVTSGVDSTTLWTKFGSTGTWISTGLTQSGTSGIFNYTPIQGEGRYYFATVARDYAGNVEPAPTGDGDTYTHYDITLPNSQVQVPLLEHTTTAHLPWTASDNLSGLNSTRLWVKFGAQGTWIATDLSQTGTSGTFEYPFTQGEGIYYFATAATDRAGNQENAPMGSGDGACEHRLFTPPTSPTLNVIANSDGDGNYTVSWNSISDAMGYTLQEAANSSFTDATTAYSGSETLVLLSNKSLGTYHYRVRATNVSGDSLWSNTRSVVVTVETGDVYEPDDACAQARALSTDGSVQPHTFHKQADTDWAVFSATAGVTYHIEAQVPLGSSADVAVEIYDQCSGVPVDGQDHSFAADVRLEFTASATGPLYLKWVNHDPEVYGTEAAYAISARALASMATPGAVIIAAGRVRGNDSLQPNIHYAAAQVYQMFQNNGYPADRIYYLATDLGQPGVDGLATTSNLQAAITTWALDKVDADHSLTLYLVDHGLDNQLYLDKPAGQIVTPGQLDIWLTQLETARPGVKINVFLEACYSGSFIEPVQSVSKPGRVVVASTTAMNLAYASNKGALFSDHFSAALNQGASIYSAFQSAGWATRAVYTYQIPWLDTNGNGIPNESADGPEAARRGFGYTGTLNDETWPPYIAQTTPVAVTAGRGNLRVEVRDDSTVRHVWAVIYPPSYTPPATQEELVQETLPTAMLLSQGNGWYGAQYTGFNEMGEYRVVFYAEDDLGLSAQPVAIMVQTGWAVYLPVVIRQ